MADRLAVLVSELQNVGFDADQYNAKRQNGGWNVQFYSPDGHDIAAYVKTNHLDVGVPFATAGGVTLAVPDTNTHREDPDQ